MSAKTENISGTYFLSGETLAEAIRELDEMDISGPPVAVGVALPPHVVLDAAPPTDMVNKPPHYRASPSGVECIEIARHLPYNLGVALAYIWRAEHKGTLVEDLRKACWHLQDEIDARLGGLK